MAQEDVTFNDIKEAAAKIGINLEEGPPEPKEPSWVGQAMRGPIPKGDRDNMCTRLAGHYLRILPRAEVEQILFHWAEAACEQPLEELFDEKDVLKCVDSIAKKVVTEQEEFTAEVWQLGDFLDNPPSEVPELIENWVRLGDLTLIVGMGGIGKSSVSLPMALSAACGVNFIDYNINEPMPVLYVDLEMGPYELYDRLKILAPNFNVDLVRQNFWGVNLSYFNYLESSHRVWLHEKLDQIRPKIIYIDNHSKFYTGDPNSEADMKQSVVIPLFRMMVEYNMAVVYMMHTGWKEKKRPRGTASIFDSASTVIVIEAGGSSPRNRLLTWTKNRPVGRGQREDKVTIWYDPNTLMLSGGGFEGSPDFLSSIGERIKRSDLIKLISEQMGYGRDRAYRYAKHLEQIGQLMPDGKQHLKSPIREEPNEGEEEVP